MPARQFYEFGKFRLDAAARVVFRGNEIIPLYPKAAETLLVLVQSAGQVVDKDELLRRVWPDTAVEEGSLTRAISILRKTLGNGSEGQEYIATISKRGYRFVALVKEVEADPADSSRLRSPGLSRSSVAVAVVVVAILGGAYAGWRMHRQPPAQRRVMVAVLPVQNLTGNLDREYIADGLTEEIIAELSSYSPERMGVIARTSSMAYRITSKTAQQIGNELGVDYLVESSLRSEGERLRITSELVRVQDQTHIWSASYDRTWRDLFALEDEVAQGIALNVGLKLQSPTRVHVVRRSSGKPDAYLAYLEGRYYWNRRSPEALERAISKFQQAIQLDPGYALAYAGLADAYASQCLIADVPPLEVFPKAKQAALKAVELDNSLAEAHTSLAYVRFWYDWDWSGAEAEFRRALDINPGYATAHQWYAEFLRLMGREEEAIRENRKALELDPLSLIIVMEAGLPYYFEAHYDEALSHYQKALDMDGNFGLTHCVLGWLYDDQGHYPAAVAELERARQLDDSSAVLGSLGHVYAVAGRSREARSIVTELQRRAKTRYVSPYFLAMIYVGLHEDGRALDALEDAYAKHDWVLVWMSVARMMQPLRTQPRFIQLMQRLNLPQQSS